MFIGACVLTGGIAHYWEASNPQDSVLIPKFWVVFGFIAGLTLIAYFMSLAGMKSKPETSVMLIMGAIALKLVISMFFVLIYLQKFKVNSLYFAAEFFSIYFLFTIFEVYALLCKLRHQNKT
jgi:phage shock protein PspC (stress-responsive transcriptional regulator)